jgi:chitinase
VCLSLLLTGSAFAQIIIDNTNTGFTTGGSWAASTGVAGYWGPNFLHDNGAGIDTGDWAKWKPTFPSTGSYKVEVRWTAHSNRPDNVKYKIYHQGVVTEVWRNQQQNNATWMDLGTYTFSAGTSESNRLTLDAGSDSGYVVADAARFTAIGGPPPTPTPCTSCGGGLPARVITGYWHNFNNGSRCLRLSDVPSRYNLIAVAFADATGTPGAVSFTLDSGLAACIPGGYSDSAFRADINTVKSRGQRVIVSVGGQNGAITVASSSAATNFANSIAGLMTSYGFQGVDIDLENGLNAQYMTQALRSIRAQRPGAILTMAPQTIDMQNVNNAYFRTALDANVDLVNMQYYNSGCMLGCDQAQCWGQGTLQFLTMQACLQVRGGLRGDQIGFGLPASPSGAGSGYVSPSLINQAMQCMATGSNCGSPVPPNRARVRGAMTWSINWDAVQGYSWVNSINIP